MRTKLLIAAALMLTLIGHFALAQDFKPQTIYGIDGRKDFYELKSPRLKTLAKKSVALVSNNRISKSKSRTKNLRGDKYGSYSRLCPDEKFYAQPSAAFCSGVLISSRHVLTAGHCIQESTCAQTSLVLDYLIADEREQSEVWVDGNNIYSCSSVVQRVVTRGIDFAVIELDRPVRDRRAIQISPEVSNYENLITTGFPSGIPLKISLGGKVRREINDYIVANLDTLSGNSGSPVYNDSFEFVGILVSGEKDYEFDRSRQCYMDRRCPEDKCMGEYVLKASTILERIEPGILNASLNTN